MDVTNQPSRFLFQMKWQVESMKRKVLLEKIHVIDQSVRTFGRDSSSPLQLSVDSALVYLLLFFYTLLVTSSANTISVLISK